MCVCETCLHLFCATFPEERIFFPSRGIVGTLSAPDGGEMDLHSAGVKSKHLLKPKKNSKQGFGCTWNETKAGARLSQ